MFESFFLSRENSKLSSQLKKLLGFTPGRLDLYKLAFTHSSVVHKTDSTKESNERLEFLGDSIIASIVAEYLFKKYPYKDEGFLTDIRSRIVKRETLNEIALKIGLKELLNYSGQVHNKNIFGNAFEALIGAIYLDKGYNTTRHFVLNKIIKVQFDIEHVIAKNDNYKSILLEWASKSKREINFTIDAIETAGNKTIFTSKVFVEGQEVGVGQATSKKMAERIAAEFACVELKLS